jgi:O-antigen/teichoic acid export membrane protein
MLMLGTNMLASVALPMMTRLGQQGNKRDVTRLHGYNARSNIIANSFAVAILVVTSQAILAAYGNEFRSGRLIFSLLLATAIPHAASNVLLQYLVARGRMWLQLLYYLLSSTALLAAYDIAIASWGAVGFAISTLGISTLSALVLNRLLASELTDPQGTAKG